MGGGVSREAEKETPARMKPGAKSFMASVRLPTLRFVRASQLTIDSQDLQEAKRIMNEQEQELSRLRHQQVVKDLQIEQLKQRLAANGGNDDTKMISRPSKPSNASAKNQRKVIMGKKDDFTKLDLSLTKVAKSDDIREMIWQVCLDNVLFSDLETGYKDAITDPFRPLEFQAGETVVTQGEHGNVFYIVESGSLRVFIKREEDMDAMRQLNLSESYKSESQVKMLELHPQLGRFTHILGPRTAFGELALMYDTPRAATIHAVTPCKLWAIKRDECRAVLQGMQEEHLKTRIAFLSQVKLGYATKNEKLGKLLTDQELARLAMAMDTEHVMEGEIIIRQGQPGNHFYIIQSGEVSVHKNSDISGRRDSSVGPQNQISAICAGGSFGELALINEDVRSASIKASTECDLLTLSRADFISHLGPVSEIIAEAHDLSHRGMGDRRSVKEADLLARLSRRSTGSTQISTDRLIEPLKIDQMQVLASLGQGSYGTVKLVRTQDSGEHFAAKCQPKYKILQESMQDYIIQEAFIMTICDSPFVLKLCGSMQTDRFVYFALEYLEGGELYGHLQRLVSFSEPMLRFYTSQVILAFSCLHEHNVIYRDLKPENIVLDRHGYIKVVDFGLSKINDSYKTWTMCGTPEYLAPEILKNEGHNQLVDFWMLGILVFELGNGQSPFAANDEMKLFERILRMRPNYPRSFSKQLKDLISRLLTPQKSRLGNSREGWAAVRKHLWFSGFDWAGITKKSMPSPLKPSTSLPDDYDEDSDLLLIETEDFSVPPCPGWVAELPAEKNSK